MAGEDRASSSIQRNEPMHHHDAQNVMTEIPQLVVGIGASAGGLDPLEDFFDKMPDDSGIAFVIVQHLSPDYKSYMPELLARRTNMPVKQAADGERIEANHVYLIPTGKTLQMQSGCFRVTDRDSDTLVNLPIDTFFESLAKDVQERAVGIILSGTGTDGCNGIGAVAQAGGLIIAQNPESSAFDGMPRAAVGTDLVDYIADTGEMPDILCEHLRKPGEERKKVVARKMGTEQLEGPFGEVFRLLRDSHSIDFNFYKPSTIERRIERRMNMLDYNTVDEYAQRLSTDSEELEILYRDLLIGVTEFMRDPAAFEILRKRVVPQIVDTFTGTEIRIWSCGCATGEEAYSLGILFNEAIRQRQSNLKLKIFATDMHKLSLETASQGLYSREALEHVPAELRKNYFTAEKGLFRVNNELRKMVIFSEHNVLKAPPFTRLNLISCRNLLIYFNNVAQRKVLSMFHYSLLPKGCLFLGKSENLSSLSDEFETIDRTWRFFRKKRDIRLPVDSRFLLGSDAGIPKGAAKSPPPLRKRNGDHNLIKAYDVILDKFAPPSILVDESHQVMHVFGKAGKYFRTLTGRIHQDVFEFFEGNLKMALTGALQKAGKESETVTYRGIPTTEEKNAERVNLRVEPVRIKGDHFTYFLIVLEPCMIPAEPAAETDSTEDKPFDADDVSRDRIQQLEQELHYSREHLQSTIEELETSNEELQATNEELLASNEELQSTNEELHSVNEELYTVNAEFERKNKELEDMGNDMQNLLRATNIGTVFIDRQMRIRSFTPAIEEMFHLLPHDTGRPIEHIAYRIQGENTLFEDIKQVIETGETIEKEVRNTDDNWFLLRVLPYFDGKKNTLGAVVTFVDINIIKRYEKELRELNEELEERVKQRSRQIVESEQRLSLALEAANAGVYEHTVPIAEGDAFWSNQWARLLGFSVDELPPPELFSEWFESRIHPQDLHERNRLLKKFFAGQIEHYRLAKRIKHKDGRWIHVEMLAMASELDRTGKPLRVVGIMQDITERIHIEEAMQESELLNRTLVENVPQRMFLKDIFGNYVTCNSLYANDLGIEQKDILDKNDYDFFPQELADQLNEDDNEVLETQETLNKVMQFPVDGELRWVNMIKTPLHDESHRATGLLGLFWDITDSKSLEDQLSMERSRLKLALQAAKIRSWDVDIEGGEIRWSDKMFDLFEISASQRASCANWLEMLAEEDRRQMREALDRVVEERIPQMQECRVAIAPDESRYYLIAMEPVLDQNAEVRKLVGVNIDLTKIRTSEHQLRERTLELEHMNKELEQILYAASHDLRSPLVNIQGFSQELQESLETMKELVSLQALPQEVGRKMEEILKHDVPEFMQFIHSSITKMDSLINGLLKISRVGQAVLDLRRVDMKKLIAEVADTFEYEMKEIDAEIEIANLPPCRGDANLLSQVFTNLIGNAIKYRHPERSLKIRLTAIEEESEVVYCVADNGIGIAPEYQQSVFDLYHQLEPESGNGEGLGLSIVRSIIEKHGGRVWIDSEEGIGSRFLVALPKE